MKSFIKSLSTYLLAVCVLFYYSCYAYYEISKEDLIDKKYLIDRIRLKDKTEINLQSSDSLSFKPQDGLVVLKQDSVYRTIKIAEIDKFIEAKYSLSKTVFFIFGLTAVVVTLFLFSMSSGLKM